MGKETDRQVDKVEAVKTLESRFGLSKIDALLAYDKFFKKYPTGEIKKDEFMEEYKVHNKNFTVQSKPNKSKTKY